MTQAQLESFMNELLASGQPDKIIAVKHRQVENAIIEELFDYQAIADRFKDLDSLISYAGIEKIMVVKNGTAYLLPTSLLPSGGGLTTGAWVMKGDWDASTDAVPNDGDATVLEGYTYDNGNFSSTTLLDPDGAPILPYATIRALVDNPGPLLSDRSKWRLTY